MGSRAYSSQVDLGMIGKRKAEKMEESVMKTKKLEPCTSSEESSSSSRLRIVNPESFEEDNVKEEEALVFDGPFPVPMQSPRYSPRPNDTLRKNRPGTPPLVPPCLSNALKGSKRKGNRNKLNEKTELHDAIHDGDRDQFDSVVGDLSKERLDAVEDSGYSGLMGAASMGDKSLGLYFCKRLIEQGVDIHIKDKEGFTALHWAAAMGSAEICDCLIQAGAELESKSENGDTPLHRAARFGRDDCIKILVEAYGASTSLRNHDHESPLDVAGRFCKNRAFVAGIRVKTRKTLLAANPKLKTLILHHDECLAHRTTHAHQEAPERVVVVYDKITNGVDGNCIHVSCNFTPANRAQLLYAHEKKYIDFVFDLHGNVSRMGSPVPFTPRVQVMNGVEEHKVKDETGCDTFFSQGSLPAALRAVGAVCNAVDRVVTGHSRNAFCVVRPPGHHAGVGGLLHNAISCGFCIFNNVAIGAMHALKTYPDRVRRIAIIDIDVHHGNGTEEIVREKINQPKNVFFFSIHLYDKPEGMRIGSGEFYPGSGGSDHKKYNVVNAPIAPLWRVPTSRTRAKARNTVTSSSNDAEKTGNGSDSCTKPEEMPFGRAAFREKIRSRLIPSLRAFDPDLVFISAGFDAGKNDVGCSRTEKGKYFTGMDLLPDDYNWVTKEIQSVANVCCNGRIVSCLEGGYGQWARVKAPDGAGKKLVLNRTQLGENALAHVKALVNY
mmetsp:Transcript_20406/g.33667  ORF Transcript_20406/g.33667 Transcript_20406/m.33667 type:complete len:720 (+) Transcript_20406:342-2501(+)